MPDEPMFDEVPRWRTKFFHAGGYMFERIFIPNSFVNSAGTRPEYLLVKAPVGLRGHIEKTFLPSKVERCCRRGTFTVTRYLRRLSLEEELYRDLHAIERPWGTPLDADIAVARP